MTPPQPATAPRTRSAASNPPPPPPPRPATDVAAGNGDGPKRKGPLKTFRFGRISAAVWENGTNEKKFYSVQFRRTYLDDAKQFQDSDSFNRDDLPLVEKLAGRAHAYIFDTLTASRSEAKETG
jgi:hypothetical protein